MLNAIVREDDFLTLVEDLTRKRRIIGPVQRDGHFFYEPVEHAAQLDLGFTYCVQSPKRYFFPPRETLFSYSRRRGAFEASPRFDPRPTAIIGVHPCDLHATRLLDHVFAADPRDDHYMTRRENTLMVGIDCAQPCTAGVFCSDMHANEIAEGFDVMLYPLDRADPAARRYGVVFGSGAGRDWLVYSKRCTFPSTADERAFEQYRASKTAAFPRALKTPMEELPNLLDRSYDSLLWEATARRCYSCGSCNLTCPTCYCFNMFDELEFRPPASDSSDAAARAPSSARADERDVPEVMAGGTRQREWDGCQLREFANTAGAHNFRPKAAQRLRHRIYRKAKWIRDRTGIAGCTGCARCDRACTAKINSVEIYNQLAEEV